MSVDAVVIGGGPAGASIGRLLASWGHSVRVLAAPGDRSRGLAESLPPSTRKLLAEIGVLAAVDAAGFLRGTGNTVCWASSEPRIEAFDTPGYQIFRPDFDAVLLDCARAAGADVRTAVVRRVDLDGEVASLQYDEAGRHSTVSCRFVIDCSGRAGVVARRFRRVDAARMFGFVGVWRSESGFTLPDPTHTIVETFDAGWAWSIPVDLRTRHVGVMVGEPGRNYEHHLARTRVLQELVGHATLERSFACDASSYASSVYAGPGFLLAGDAGSFIDPLSSCGVKKALASAWLGAIAVHTSLTHADRQDVALQFFGDREREMETAHRREASAFAVQAYERHRTPFWEHRCPPQQGSLPRRSRPPSPLRGFGEAGCIVEGGRDDILAAFEWLKATPSIDLRLADHLPLERRPVVRGREIVVEDAFAGGLRFAANVDLLTLARMAPRHQRVPDLFDAYCRDCAPVPLPSLVSGLSMLVAKGILHER